MLVCLRGGVTIVQDSFYEHVKSGEKHLNDLESQILRYIISLHSDLEQATSKGIAAHFYVAPNTIVRLAHKLGFTGFTDLKHSYLLSLERNRYAIETIPLDLQIIQTKDLVHDQTIEAVARAIERAEHIVFFCSGLSKFPCLEMEEKLRKNRFTLQDFYDQLQQLRGMGDLSQLAGMMPGQLGRQMQNASIDEKQLAHTEAIILSMTPLERENPQILNASRKRRIAAGCGLEVVDVNRLLKQFDAMQQMVKQLSKGRMGGMGGRMHGFGRRKRLK